MPRLSGSDQLLIRDASARLAVLADGKQLGLAAVKDELVRLIPAQCAVAFSLESTATHLRVEHAATSSSVDACRVREQLDALLSRQPTKFTAWNAQRPEPWQRNKVVSVIDYLGWEGLRRLPMFQHVVVPMKWDRYHQLRALSCEGQTLLAWVGVLREEPFTTREKAVLQAVLPAIRRRLEVDLRLRQAEFALAALDLALEAIGAPAFVVRSGPVVVHLNSAGRALLDRDRTGTLEGLQAMISGAPKSPAKSFAISAPGLADHHLCIWRPAPADLLPRAAIFAHQYGLSPRETEVLMHVVRGKPNKIIAAELGRAEVTIEVHVGAVLERTDCGNRAELIARFWSGDA